MQDTASRDSSLVRHKAEWDGALFAEKPRRAELARLKASWPLRTVRVRVHRNHAFEHVASACAAWAAYDDTAYAWDIGGYDDSLSLGEMSGGSDVELVWYDAATVAGRLGDADFAQWFVSRLTELRRRTPSPILVCLIGASDGAVGRIRDQASGLAGLRLADVAGLLPLSELIDERFAKASGSRLSERANLRLALMLGSCWLPSLTRPRIKAVLVDLDLTLYRGVLGEDGLQVELTPGHRQLQEALVRLRDSGLFLGIISRNDAGDVSELFGKRADFPLRWEHFATRQVGWGAKSDAIRRACDELRIAPDAVLYLDDNLGELLEVAAHLPSISLLHAKADASLSARALAHFPGIWSWGKSESDLVRQADLQANAERSRISASLASDPHAYFRELAPEVTLLVSRPETAHRLHELSQKTNQFNLAMRRLSEVEVAGYLTSPESFAVGISLRDRLSDSGMIAAMFGRFDGDTVLVDEWVVSCRALGRGLEDYMATQALLAAARDRAIRRVVFAHATGPRNHPARTWLAAYVARPLVGESGCADLPARDLRGADIPVSLTIQNHG